MGSFRQALRQLDFVEGRNVVIGFAIPEQDRRSFPDLAAELVRPRRVDVITAFGDHAPRVVQQATQAIPIVAISDDMFGAGIIALSRPGGNTTGLTIMAGELTAWRVEVLPEMVPGYRAWRPPGIPRPAYHRLRRRRMPHGR